MSELTKPSSSAPYLLSSISKQTLDPKTLSTHQRRICIRFLLMEGKHAQYEIAAILKCDQAVVTRDKHRIQNQNSYMLDELDERKIAIQIIQSAESTSARLIRAGRHRDAWTVNREAVDILQSLGYLKRAAIEFKGEVSVQEILKLANSPDKEDETLLGERSGQGRKNFITNGTS